MNIHSSATKKQPKLHELSQADQLKLAEQIAPFWDQVCRGMNIEPTTITNNIPTCDTVVPKKTAMALIKTLNNKGTTLEKLQKIIKDVAEKQAIEEKNENPDNLECFCYNPPCPIHNYCQNCNFKHCYCECEENAIYKDEVQTVIKEAIEELEDVNRNSHVWKAAVDNVIQNLKSALK